MQRFVTAAAAAAILTFATGASADPRAGEALAKNSGCAACHSVDKKTIGPSYKDIAAKYRNDKGAEAGLTKKVKAGGAGVWGQIPMPPHAHIKDDDIRSMVQWILATK